MTSNVSEAGHVNFSDLDTGRKIFRYMKSLTFRLQACAIFLSLVGIGFGLKSYIQVRQEFGYEASAFLLTSLWFQIGVAIAANILVAFIIYKICTSPVRKLTDAMSDLTQGNLDTEVPFSDYDDEIGSMARRVLVFKNNAFEKQKLEQKQKEEERHAAEERRKMLDELARNFESGVGQVVQSLNETIAQFDTTSSSLANVVKETNGQVEAASNATCQTSDNMQSVAAATEELSTSIDEVGHKTDASSKSVREAVDQSENANDRVQKLSKAMDEISEITDMIQNIAEQTNLLALNATIEAARAGDAGKGFAVVANEVKTLASQTGQATERISSRIGSLQTETRDVVSVIGNITQTVRSLDEMVQAVSEAMEHERAAISEISRSVQETSNLGDELNENIRGVANASEKTDSAAKDVIEGVGYLKDQTAKLDENMQTFLKEIRS